LENGQFGSVDLILICTEQEKAFVIDKARHHVQPDLGHILGRELGIFFARCLGVSYADPMVKLTAIFWSSNGSARPFARVAGAATQAPRATGYRLPRAQRPRESSGGRGGGANGARVPKKSKPGRVCLFPKLFKTFFEVERAGSVRQEPFVVGFIF
jgi:hypothetical protein